MKFSLALALVSLSVLTAAKHEFVRKANGNHNPSKPCPSPLVPGKDNTCIPPPKHEFVRKANGDYNPSEPCPPPLVPGKDNTCIPPPKHEFVRKANGNYDPSQPGGNGASTPANSQPKQTGTGSTSGKSSSGWVQNPSGKASFTGRSGCSSPGKSFTHSYIIPWNSLSATFSPQRAARK